MAYIGMRRGLKNAIANPLLTKHAPLTYRLLWKPYKNSQLLFPQYNSIKYEKLSVIGRYRILYMSTPIQFP